MFRKVRLALMFGACCGLLAGGCDRQIGAEPSPPPVTPPYVAGTISEQAALLGGGAMPVQGYGVVVGLGRDGSQSVPAHLQNYLEQMLARHGFGSPRRGTAAATPERILRDPDTAVVMLAGAIPYGAPVGARFDLNVAAIPQTETRSLDGGYLITTDLRYAWRGMATPGHGARIFAEADGPMFVDPLLDRGEGAPAEALRRGCVLGGGKVTVQRPIRLQLREPDYAMVQAVQNRINERFFDAARKKVANATNRSTIELTVPARWHDDYQHFLALVMHLPMLRGPGAYPRKAREVVEAMELPEADCDRLALVLEAMGPSVQTVIREAYSSRNPAARFHAARAGLRIGDELAAEVVLNVARKAGSPHQVAAIRELGRHPDLARAQPTLEALLDDASAAVRVAAYEALRRRGPGPRVASRRIDGMEWSLQLDVVASRCQPAIYATQSLETRVVIFGRGLQVRRPVYFAASDELVTVTAREDDANLTVFRKVPVTGQLSDAYKVAFDVPSLIEVLVRLEDDGGRIVGLGLTYGQLVRVLASMCRQGQIPATFALQEAPSLPKMPDAGVSTGRPNVGPR
jgi:hypothetical protein